MAWGRGTLGCSSREAELCSEPSRHKHSCSQSTQTSSCRPQFSWLYGRLSFQVNKDLSHTASVPRPTLGLWDGHICLIVVFFFFLDGTHSLWRKGTECISSKQPQSQIGFWVTRVQAPVSRSRGGQCHQACWAITRLISVLFPRGRVAVLKTMFPKGNSVRAQDLGGFDVGWIINSFSP